MKLSRTAGYAIQAMVELGSAGQGALVASRRLAEASHIPDRFLLQILRTLVENGILRSTRGVVGGYSLAKDPGEISLLEIIEAIEGPVQLMLPSESPGWENASNGLTEATSHLREQLAGVRLAELLPNREAAPQTM